MTPYLAMLSARFRLLLQYRVAAFAGIGTQVFWGMIRMMILSAFYAHAVNPPMRLDQVIAYVWLGQAFFALLPFRTDAELDQLITTGNVAYELLRPVDLYGFWYCRAIASRIAPTTLRAVPIIVIAGLMGWLRWPGIERFAAFALCMTVTVLLAASFTMLLSVTMFWTMTGRGITAIMSGMMFLLSGMVIPLPLFPDSVQRVINLLPFRGICDLPYRIFSGHIPLDGLPGVLLSQVGWTIALVICGRLLLRHALKRLVVQGG